jgi:hypothetical protein
MKLSGDGNKLCSAHLFATKFHIQFISRKKIIKQIENLLTPISYTGKKIAPPYTSPSFRGKTLVRLWTFLLYLRSESNNKNCAFVCHCCC